MKNYLKTICVLFAFMSSPTAKATTMALANYHTSITLTYLLCILLIVLGAISCIHILQMNKARHRAISLASHYSALFNNTNISTEFFDADGYLIDINQAACKLFGIKDRKEYVRSKPNIFEDPVMRKYIDKKNPQQFNRILKEDFDEICKDEYFRLWNIRGLHHIDTYFTPIYDNNQHITGFIVNDNDVTEIVHLNEKMKLYSEKMAYVLKSTNTLAWAYDPDNKLCSAVNDNENNQSKLSCQEMLKHIDKDSLDEVNKLFETMSNRTTDKVSLQVKFTDAFGNPKPQYYMIEGSAIKDENGHITKYSGLSHNVTRLIEIQTVLEKEKEKAQQADKLKSAFLANMSHEIRTPLNAIVGFSQMLQSAEDDAQRQSFINIINTNKDYLLKRINDILELSEIKSGVIVPEPSPFDLVAMLTDLCSTFQISNNKPDVTIQHSFPSECYIINTDRRILMQIIYNFIDNAIKFTQKGHITVGFELKEDTIDIYVCDTGIGIPEEKISDTFDSFCQLDPFTQGVGLGLTICKANATLLGGTISVKSEMKKGSTFTVSI